MSEMTDDDRVHWGTFTAGKDLMRGQLDLARDTLRYVAQIRDGMLTDAERNARHQAFIEAVRTT